MKISIILLAVAASAFAKPDIFGYDFTTTGNLYDYRFPYYNGYFSKPLVGGIIPDTRTSILPYNIPSSFIKYPDLNRQFLARDALGQVSYGHIEPGQIHTAFQDAAGNKRGFFKYINAEGKLIETSYIADERGYQVSSNDLPIAPIDKPVLPVPPIDTPEVAAAKAAHLGEVEAVKGRSKRDAPILNTFTNTWNSLPYDYRFTTSSHAYPTSNLLPKVTKNGFLEETPEVIAAKTNHFAEVEIAKARIAALTPLTSSTQILPSTPILPPKPIVDPLKTIPYDYYLNSFPFAYQTSNVLPEVTSDGFLKETPEVIAAKKLHFAEMAAAKIRNGVF